MANIESYLRDIRLAEYGEDVRGSIHDAIKNINEDSQKYTDELVGTVSQTVNSMGQKINEISKAVTEEIKFESKTGYIWTHSTGMQELLVESSSEAEGGETKAVKLEVESGQTYMITTSFNSYYTNGLGCPVISSVYEMVEGQYRIVDDTYNPLIDNGNEYIVTIPENSSHLLINADNDFQVRVWKIRESGSSSGMKILWSGLLNCDGYVGLNNEGVEFSIPKDCFFNDGKELILAINGYCPEDDFSAFPLLMVGMCFGNAEDFGLDPDSELYPYKCGDFSRYILHEERFVTESSSNYSVIRIDVHVKKVADSRYAVCTVQNRSSHFYITSISAVLAG